MQEKLQLVNDIEFYKNKKSLYMISSEEKGIHIIVNEKLFYYLNTYVTNLLYKKTIICDSDKDKAILFLKRYGFLYSKYCTNEKKTTVEAEILGKIIYSKNFKVDRKSMVEQYFLLILIMISTILLVFNLCVVLPENIFGEIASGYSEFNFKNISFIGIITILIFVSLGIHEAGHILFANYFSVYIKNITICLHMGISPMAFVKYKNIYKRSKAARIIIYGGGIILNLFTANISLTILYITNLWIFAVMAMVNLLMVVNNILLFYKTDFYFILCELFDLGSLKYKVLIILSKLLNREMKLQNCLKEKGIVKILIFFTISYTGTLYLLYSVFIKVFDMINPRSNIQVLVLSAIAVYYISNFIQFINRIKNKVYR